MGLYSHGIEIDVDIIQFSIFIQMQWIKLRQNNNNKWIAFDKHEMEKAFKEEENIVGIMIMTKDIYRIFLSLTTPCLRELLFIAMEICWKTN